MRRVRVDVTSRCARRAARDLVRVAANPATVRRCSRATEGTPLQLCSVSRSRQVTLFVVAAPPAAHGLRAGRPLRRPGGATARPDAAHAEGVEVVAPAAPSAPPLESDGYPSSKQPVHPNSLPLGGDNRKETADSVQSRPR